MRRFTIRLRMLGAIGVLLAMFGLIGAVGVACGLQIQALNESVMVHSVHETQAVAAVRQHLARVRLLEKQMVIDYENGAEVGKLRESWKAALGQVRQAFESLLEGEDDEDNAPAREALARLKAYEERSAPVLKNIQDGGYDNAKVADRMLARAKDEVAVAEQRVEQIADIVQAELVRTRADFESTMRTALVVFLATLLAVVLFVAPSTLLNSYSITRPISYAVKVAESIAAGDLTRPIRHEGQDEASELLAALEHMQASLRNVVSQVQASSVSIQHSSAEVASGNGDLSQRTEQAAGSLQQTASSMEQFTATVRQSAEAAGQAKTLAASAAGVAQRGGEVVSQVVSTMDEINSSSRRIADIIGTIDGIAFQTNILALNAAVEAARAGEQGRGFAVVASEVRSLAQRSAAAAREIKSLIGASVERVEVGSQLVASAGSTMNDIVASVQRVADIVGEISTAAADQSQGIGQVNGAVSDLDRMTQQNAALVEQSAAAAESLREQAATLSSLVATFRLRAG
ncbi:MAG: HAMP domain-containing protein [Rubrivivax sp.]|nr:HAMP domain-containing protein [Rubrivivax sp.]